MAPRPVVRRCRGDGHRRPLLLSAVLVAGTTLAARSASSFVSARMGYGAGARERGERGASSISRHAYTEISSTAGLAGFQGNDLALYVSLGAVVLTLPGVWSTVTRTGQAKYIEKSYVMPGVEEGGLEMRSIAGGLTAYFRGRNYKMEDSPQAGKIRFVGNLQGSVSQALYLSGCLLGAFISLGFVAQSIFPQGPFDIGANWWYAPSLISPAAGWYYWGRAFRRDLVELQLELSDDKRLMQLTVLGDRETIELMQQGVRFQSPEGQLFQLMERGMEYQPGIFDPTAGDVTVYKEKAPVAGAA